MSKQSARHGKLIRIDIIVFSNNENLRSLFSIQFQQICHRLVLQSQLKVRVVGQP